MGIRFHCNHCEKRLNVKATQAGEFCICPDCENEIQIPLESTIEPKKKRKSKKRRTRTVEVDVSPVEQEAAGVELAASRFGFPVVAEQGDVIVADDSSTESYSAATFSNVPSEKFSEDGASVGHVVVDGPAAEETPFEDEVFAEKVSVEVDRSEQVSPEDLEVDAETPPSHIASAEPQETTSEDLAEQELVLAPLHKPVSSTKNLPRVPAEFESRVESESEEPFAESITIGDDEEIDSASALDQLLDSSDELETESPSEETESFLLAKPVAKIEEHPLKGNPDLVWYLRHKRLGEKGPLKAREIETMLESGQIRRGFIVWREDWNDWLPAEKIFPELAEKKAAQSTYEIPEDLNPHSEVNRKRRAKKRFWLCFNAAAFLLIIVLVYWVTQFGS